MNQLAAKTQPKFSLTVLTGPDKGATYQLVAGRITIGRGSDNDIIIRDDTKVSRNHAAIQISASGVEISDTSDKNKLFVNGKEVPAAILTHGSIIQIGGTKLSFNTLKEDTYLDLVLPGDRRPNSPRHRDAEGAPTRRSSRSQRKVSGSKLNFYIILGVLSVGGFFLFNSKPKSTTDSIIRDNTEVNRAIEDRKKQIEQFEKDLKEKKQKNIGFDDAQTNYIRGFRDYQKGRYDRAIEYFASCARILPQCERYLGLANKKFDDLVQSQMNFGRKYMDQGQYRSCASTFKNVMYMLKDKTSQRYKEAEQNAAYCQRIGGNQF